MNARNKNRVNNNPYLTGITLPRVGAARTTFGSEAQRLLGHPWRFFATLFLVVFPAIMALAGALDLLIQWLYSVSHQVTSDPRPAISAFECLLADQSKKVCQGLIWASPASSKRLVLYPWHGFEPLNRLEPYLFFGFFVTAVIGFVSIGSPRFGQIGRTFWWLIRGLKPEIDVEPATGSPSNSRKGRARAANILALALDGKVQHTGLAIEAFSSRQVQAALAKGKIKINKSKNKRKSNKEVNDLINIDPKPDRSLESWLPRAAPGPVPRALLDLDCPEKFWERQFILGAYIERFWESDPGYFWFDKAAGSTSNSKAGTRSVPYWMSLNALRTGLIIVAPQGSGKTASIFKPLRNFVERSQSCGLFFDIKSGENSDGSGTDFPPHLFDLNFDATREASGESIKLNLFAGQTPAQAGERLAEALIPDLGGDKSYFSNNAKSAMSSLVAAYHALMERYPSLVEILNFLSYPANLEDLNEKLLLKLTGPRREEGHRLSTLLRRVINLAGNKNTDTLGNLATALEPLVTDIANRLLVTNPEPGAYTVEELVKEPRLIRLALPVANHPRIYPIIGRLVLAQFTYAVLSPECNRGIFKLIAVDEARFFITDNVAGGMAQARSNNAGFALSFQTLTQIRDETLLDNIFANAGTKLVMGKVSDKDAERYSRLFGTIELPYVTHSSSINQGITKNSGRGLSMGNEVEVFSSGTSGREARATRSTSRGSSANRGRSEGMSLTTRTRRRFLDSEVRELEQRHGLIESSDDQGQVWFAQVINMDAAIVRNLEQQVNNRIAALVRKNNKHKGKHKSQRQEQEPGQVAPVGTIERTANPTLVQSVGKPRMKIRLGQPIPTQISPTVEPAPAPVVPVTPELTKTAPIQVVTVTVQTGPNIPIAAAPAIPVAAPAQVQAQTNAQPEAEAEAEQAAQLAAITELLRAANLKESQLEEAALKVVSSGRSLEELNRLITYSRNRGKTSVHAGSYIAGMIRKNSYPAIKPAAATKNEIEAGN